MIEIIIATLLQEIETFLALIFIVSAVKRDCILQLENNNSLISKPFSRT